MRAVKLGLFSSLVNLKMCHPNQDLMQLKSTHESDVLFSNSVTSTLCTPHTTIFSPEQPESTSTIVYFVSRLAFGRLPLLKECRDLLVCWKHSLWEFSSVICHTRSLVLLIRFMMNYCKNFDSHFSPGVWDGERDIAVGARRDGESGKWNWKSTAVWGRLDLKLHLSDKQLDGNKVRKGNLISAVEKCQTRVCTLVQVKC